MDGGDQGSKQGVVGVIRETPTGESGIETWNCRYRFKYASGLPREASDDA
jgi:hypothetical protein